MTVSVGIIAYNEEIFLKNVLNDILSQDYPHELTEIILVNSCSDDGTLKLMTDFAEKYRTEYNAVKVYENPKKSQAAGWNVVLENADNEVIIRVDAHAHIPSDFISANIKILESGEMISGGPRPNITGEDKPYSQMLLLAESSMFGSSVAGYRREDKQEKKYVKSLFHGAYRREVFAAVGGFDEALGRTEDNELHYRMRKAGYRFCYSDSVHSYQYIRSSLCGMLGQKFQNGRWIGLTIGYCPQCLSIYHFVPFCFVGAIGICLILLILGFCFSVPLLTWGLPALMSLYGLVDLLMTVAAWFTAPEKHIVFLLLFPVFFLLHITYGVGTMIGIIQLPFHLKRYGGSNKNSIEYIQKIMQRKCGISDK